MLQINLINSISFSYDKKHKEMRNKTLKTWKNNNQQLEAPYFKVNVNEIYSSWTSHQLQ